MRFIIKPGDDSINTIAETIQYRRLWRENARKLRKSLRKVTGLEFQQRTITARVIKGDESNSGSPYHPMVLRGDNQPPDYKLMLMIHELFHRLVAGNALAPGGLRIRSSTEYDDQLAEISHRHLYLFEYDVVKDALGKQGTVICRMFEERSEKGSPHDLAWKWAMGLSDSERQRALKWLVAQALPRERWHERNTNSRKWIKPEAWHKKLESAATTQ